MTVPPTNDARPPGIEDPTNRWFVHPIADRLLAPALAAGIHPNAVSFAGLGCGALAGACYAHWRQPGFVLAGFALMVAWHVLDGLDGKLARASGKATALGRVIDGTCDYLVFFCVLIPIAVSFDDWSAMLTLCLTAGGFHAVQAGWYEGEREAWKRRSQGDFVPRPRATTGSLAAVAEVGQNWLESRLVRVRPIDAVLAADPARLPAYLAATAPLLRQASLVSANNRTIAIAIACLVGNPSLYWYWEIAGLSLAAVAMALRLRRCEGALVAAAGRSGRCAEQRGCHER